MFIAEKDGSNITKISLKYGDVTINKIKAIESADGVNFLIGTFDQGLWHYNIKSNKIRQIHPEVLDSRVIFSSLKITGDILWIATRSTSLFKYNIKSQSIEQANFYDPFLGNNIFRGIWKLYEVSKRILWATTNLCVFLKS